MSLFTTWEDNMMMQQIWTGDIDYNRENERFDLIFKQIGKCVWKCLITRMAELAPIFQY